MLRYVGSNGVSCDWQFLPGISGSSFDTAGRREGRHPLTADPAFVRDSQVSCSLWSCSAHSSQTGLGVLFTWYMTVFVSGTLPEPLQAAGKSESKTAFIKRMCYGYHQMLSGTRDHTQNIPLQGTIRQHCQIRTIVPPANSLLKKLVVVPTFCSFENQVHIFKK